jgi:NitT/TauT family transport system substrate-binding protein
MINRRDFNIAIGSAAILSASPAASAKEGRVFRVTNPNGISDATQCFNTCGRHPQLGYYEKEGVSRISLNVTNTNQAMVAIAQGQADLGSLTPALFIPAIVKAPALGLIGVYNWLPRSSQIVIVPSDSNLKSVADLTGKRIGVRSLGDGSSAGVRLIFDDLGLKLGNTKFQAIGDIGMAGNALKNGSVDAMATYDTIGSRIASLGFNIRYLPLPDASVRGAAVWYGVRAKGLKENRKEVVGLLRATAKSILFAYHNLTAAIKIHWMLYPESLPKSRSEAEALEEMLAILKDRRDHWMRRPDDPEQRFGATSPDDWDRAKKTAIAFSDLPGLDGKLANHSTFYTNELIDEINEFDREAVIKQAKTFKI